MNWTTKPDRSIWSIRFMQTYPTMTAAMVRITIPVTSPPRNVPTSIPTGFPSSCGLDKMVGHSFSTYGSCVEVVTLGCGSGVQEGLHTLTMVAVWLPTGITVLVLAALSWNMLISVDAVISPLFVEYTTVVVKVRVVLSSTEQVTSDSSKSEEVKLQEHTSWIVFAMLVFSICWASSWRMLFVHMRRKNIYDFSNQGNNPYTYSSIKECQLQCALTFKLSHCLEPSRLTCISPDKRCANTEKVEMSRRGKCPPCPIFFTTMLYISI